MAPAKAALASQKYQLTPVDELTPHPENPNRGDVEGIGESVEENGFFGAVLAQRSSGHILAGEHRWRAAKAKGLQKVPTLWIEVDDARARKILAADNGYAKRGRDDPDALFHLLGEIATGENGLAGTSFDRDDLAALLRAQRAPVDLGGRQDYAPSRPRVARVEPGQLWQLGPHRMLCGDATKADEVERVLAGETADMVWTDPPYGVAYVGKTAEALTIDNDALEGQALTDLLEAAFANAFAACRPGGAWFVTAPGGPNFVIFGHVLMQFGVWRQTLIWLKDIFVLGRADYHAKHEPIFYGWKPGDPANPTPETYEPILYGWRPGAPHEPPPDRKQDSVWEFPRPKRSLEHPTMKPVGLIERAITNHTELGAVVLDPFAGSGSTLIAAHKAGRTACVLELDPIYADVICARWQAITGERPMLAPTGTAHDFSTRTHG